MSPRRRRAESLHPDPTPEEIALATAAIRRTWSATERARRVGVRPMAWMPPVISAGDMPDWLSDSDAA